jgi:hypothetical protein
MNQGLNTDLTICSVKLLGLPQTNPCHTGICLYRIGLACPILSSSEMHTDNLLLDATARLMSRPVPTTQ